MIRRGAVMAREPSPGSTAAETPSGKDVAYENFPVGSFLLPRATRRHVAVFYAFARAAVAEGVAAMGNALAGRRVISDQLDLRHNRPTLRRNEEEVVNVVPPELTPARVYHSELEKRSFKHPQAGVAQEGRRSPEQVHEREIGNVLEDMHLRLLPIFLNHRDHRVTAGVGIGVTHKGL